MYDNNFFPEFLSFFVLPTCFMHQPYRLVDANTPIAFSVYKKSTLYICILMHLSFGVSCINLLFFLSQYKFDIWGWVLHCWFLVSWFSTHLIFQFQSSILLSIPNQ